jgi:hypothetical protein
MRHREGWRKPAITSAHREDVEGSALPQANNFIADD